MPDFLEISDGRSVAIEHGMVIGRDSRVEIPLQDTKASRRHARLISQGGVVELEDLESSNGTLLNGKPIERRMLRDGDEIRIGTTTLRFVVGAEAAPATGAVEFAPGEDLFGDAPEPPPARVEPAEPLRAPQPEPAAPPVSAPAPQPAPPRAPEPFEPVVEVRQAAEPAAPAAGGDEVLEFADDEVVVVKRALPGPKRGAPPVVKADRSGGVLQFNKVEDRSGVVVQDLNQMSLPVRLGLTLVALAIAAGLFWGAMKLAS